MTKTLAAGLLCGAAIVVAPAGAGAAQDDALANAYLEECRGQADSDARIACLEEAVAELAGQVPERTQRAMLTGEEPPVSGLGAEQVMASQDIDRPESDDDEESLESTVVGFTRGRSGNYVFVLENDQIWAQRSYDDTYLRLKEGETYRVEVIRGFLSGYRMRFLDLNRRVKVHRLR